MLSLRYRNSGESSEELFLDYDDCHEILDDEDIESFLGKEGMIKELRHKTNFFCSEEELVEYMSIPLDEGSGEIYYIPDTDEGTKLCIIFRAEDLVEFHDLKMEEASRVLRDACLVIKEAIEVGDLKLDCSINYIQSIVEACVIYTDFKHKDSKTFYDDIMGLSIIGINVRDKNNCLNLQGVDILFKVREIVKNELE